MSAYKMLGALIIIPMVVATATDDNNMQSLTQANTYFGRNILNTLGPSYDNIVFSPYSLHSALTMTSMGATGETKEEMAKVLGLSSMTDDAINQAYRTLIRSFNHTRENVDVLTGNALFQNPRFTIMKEFKDLVAAKYYAVAEQLNFSAPGMAEKMINDYVEEKTENMIKDLFAPGSLDEKLVKLVLVNTLFFNGSWTLPFDKADTEKADFYVSADETVKVDMMTRKGFYMMKFGDTFNTLKLPLVGYRFALYFVVSNASTMVKSMCLSESYPDQFFTELENTEANIFVPKFEINFKKSLPLLLQTLGMPKAFTSDAEFSKISPNTLLSEVIHQAVIQVTETGTTAAAASAVVAAVNSAPFPTAVPDFRVDQPFLFFLRDDGNKEILFQGKFSRPQQDPKMFTQEVEGDVISCDDGNGASTVSLAVIGSFVSALYSLAVFFRVIN